MNIAPDYYPDVPATGEPHTAVWRSEQRVDKKTKSKVFNVKADYQPAKAPRRNLHTLDRQTDKKLATFNPILESRLREARGRGAWIDPPRELAQRLDQAISFFARDPNFAAMSIVFLQDESVELSRVTADKRDIDYLNLDYSEEEGVVVSFSRFVNKQSLLHTYGPIDDILEQIVGLDRV